MEPQRMQSGFRFRWEHHALISGVIFVLLQLIVMGVFAAVILPALGDYTASSHERATAYLQNAELLRVGNYFLMMPVVFFLFFLGGLYSILRRLEGEGSVLTMAAVLSGAAMAMLWPTAGVLSDIAIDVAERGGDAAVIASLDAIGPYLLALSAFPRTVLLLASTVLLLPARLVAGWVSWLGILAAVLSFAGSATLVVGEVFPVLALGSLLFDLWLLALCISLLRRVRMKTTAGGHVAPMKAAV